MKLASVRAKIQVGVFVLTVVAVAAVVLLAAGDKVALFRHSASFVAHFSNASGLIEGAPVRIGGVEVGRVDAITIRGDSGSDSGAATGDVKSTDAAPGYTGHPVVVAKFSVLAPYDRMVRQDASVKLETQGVLGDKYVALSPGTSTESLAAGGAVRVVEDRGLAEVMEKSSVIVDNLQTTTKRVAGFADGLPDATVLRSTTADLVATAREIRMATSRLAADDSLISMLKDPASAAQFKTALARLADAADHADSIAKKIDEGKGTLGALVNDRSLYEDLRGLLGHTDRAKIARRTFREAAEPSER